MSFSVTILGSSSAKPTANRHHSSQVVNICEQYYLIDAGEGCQQQMFRYGINPLKLKGIFISHLHGDHIYGLFPLISTLGLYGRKTPLTIYAPAPFGDLLKVNMQIFGAGLSYEVKWEQVDTKKHKLLFSNRTIEVWSIPLIHRAPCSGYLFKERDPELNINKFKIIKHNLTIAQITAAKRGEDVELETGEIIPNKELTYTPYRGRGYAYLSDTSFSESAAELCRGVDLLYHEATYSCEEHHSAQPRGHSTTHEAARAAVIAQARELVIGHFSTRYKELDNLLIEARELFPNTKLAIEGERFEIDKIKL